MSLFIVHPTKMIAASLINPQAYNPRVISKEELSGLKKSIREYGFVESLVIRKEGKGLIGGHQRLVAVKEICSEDKVPLPKLPCMVLDITERSAKMLNIALNKLGGKFENKMLGSLLASIAEQAPLTAEDTTLMGFNDSDEVTRLLSINKPAEIDPNEDLGEFGNSVTLSLAFKDVEMRNRLKKTLMGQREAQGDKPTGHIIYELMFPSA